MTSGEAQAVERIAELTASRRAVADAYEIERHRIERDLHDGAQQYLVAALMKLGEASLDATGPGGATFTPHGGLSGMRERLEAFDGSLELSSPIGGPSRLVATIPLLLDRGEPGVAPMNIVLADDSALLREGIAGLLERRGHTIVAQVSDADELLHLFDDAAALPTTPDILITDVRMPPNMADDGLKAAVTLRAAHPNLAIMVISQHVAPAYAVDLFAGATTAGTGYLLKDRVADVASFL